MGGIETHCQELYPRLAEKGVSVTVFARKGYTKQNEPYYYRGVHVVPVLTPGVAGLEAFVHTFRCFCKVLKLRPDVVHLHAIGPSAIAPLFKMAGLKVVYTHHGQDYNRAKWGSFAKSILRLSERLGTKFSNRVIVISEYLKNWLNTKYGCNKTVLIHNGVNIPKALDESVSVKYLEKYDIVGKRYIFALGRFVEEKGFHDLIAAYKKADLGDVTLVIAGTADHECEYSKGLRQMAAEAGVVLPGFIHGEELQAFFENSSLFVIPSYHEGLPIVLLEALSYNLNVIASDIPANTEVPLPKECFYPMADVDALAQKLTEFLNSPVQRNFLQVVREHYDWDKIADQTYKVYEELVQR
ncbi:MAG: glycosyltransferase family 4 protein [Fibrobacter sp.]|nr:glycosyltransferase family 4 protein [Fibrobacter sp.]